MFADSNHVGVVFIYICWFFLDWQAVAAKVGSLLSWRGDVPSLKRTARHSSSWFGCSAHPASCGYSCLSEGSNCWSTDHRHWHHHRVTWYATYIPALLLIVGSAPSSCESVNVTHDSRLLLRSFPYWKRCSPMLRVRMVASCNASLPALSKSLQLMLCQNWYGDAMRVADSASSASSDSAMGLCQAWTVEWASYFWCVAVADRGNDSVAVLWEASDQIPWFALGLWGFLATTSCWRLWGLRALLRTPSRTRVLCVAKAKLVKSFQLQVATASAFKALGCWCLGNGTQRGFVTRVATVCLKTYYRSLQVTWCIPTSLKCLLIPNLTTWSTCFSTRFSRFGPKI